MTPTNTTVVLLAAGRGARMRKLTQTTPKPLLKVAGKSLIEHHLDNICRMGFKNVVINTAYLGEQIQNHLGDGSRFSLNIQYSDESETGALETAGGLRQALELIQSDPFLVVNADIFTDFDFTRLLTPLNDASAQSGRLVLVENPPQNPDGDFWLTNSGETEKISRTFSGVALYSKDVFANLLPGKQALGPILKSMVKEGRLELVEHLGEWTDVGTPERLEQLNSALS